jgi:hypothetical protein
VSDLNINWDTDEKGMQEEREMRKRYTKKKKMNKDDESLRYEVSNYQSNSNRLFATVTLHYRPLIAHVLRQQVRRNRSEANVFITCSTCVRFATLPHSLVGSTLPPFCLWLNKGYKENIIIVELAGTFLSRGACIKNIV